VGAGGIIVAGQMEQFAQLIEEITQRGPEWAGDVGNALAVAGILAGLMNCFFGYRMFRMFFACLGFILGAAAGAWAGYTHGGEAHLVWALVGGAVGGIVGAVTLFRIYLAGVFVAGGAVAVVLSAAVLVAAGIELPPVVMLVPLVLGGGLALVLQKLVIIAVSSFGGALGVVCAVGQLTGWTAGLAAGQAGSQVADALRTNPQMWGAWLALGLLGVFVQYRFTAGGREPATTSTCDG